MIKNLYLVEKRGHWCKYYSAKAINAETYEKVMLNKLRPQLIKNILLGLLSIPRSFILPKAKTYIVSEFDDLITVKIKKLMNKNIKIIHLVFSDYYSNNHKGLKRKFMNYLVKNINGVIVPGEKLSLEVNKQDKKLKVKICPHFLKNEDFFLLTSKKREGVLGIGIYGKPYRKGEDIFVEIAKKLPQDKFCLLGDFKYLEKNIFNSAKKIKNLKFPGFVNPQKYLNEFEFFLLPGRYDAGPIATIEAMAAGLIPVTSDRNGSADIVKKIRADLVINTLDAEDYARKIKSINKSSEEKKYLSRRARLIAKEHSFKKGSERLNRVFNTFK